MNIDEIELLCHLNVEVSDESGRTHVYAYTDDGDRIGFEFNSMNPPIDDVFAVAKAIDVLRVISNRRPRVGKTDSQP